LIELDLEEHITRSIKSLIDEKMATVDLGKIITEQMDTHISNMVANTSNRILSNISSTRNFETEVANIVSTIVTDHVMQLSARQVNEKIAEMDLSKLIKGAVSEQLIGVIEHYTFPPGSIANECVDFTGFNLSQNNLSAGTIKQFASTGISDQADKIQLTVNSDGVIITDNITAQNLLIADNTFTNNITVEGLLDITGTVAQSPALDDYITNIAGKLIAQNNKQDIDLSDKQIISDGRSVLSADTLGPQIVNSNLRKVGNLTELTVSGQAVICDTLVVTDNRVGINTEEAAGALSVWDQDAEFSLVKSAQRTMFAGSTRTTDVSLGTNNTDQIRLKTTGEVELLGKVRIAGLLIRAADRIPEDIGEPGEIAIVQNGQSIYKCLGGNSWHKVL
jgi:hypothetical protein